MHNPYTCQLWKSLANLKGGWVKFQKTRNTYFSKENRFIFQIKKVIEWEFIETFNTQSKSLISDCFHNARGWNGGRTWLKWFLESHVHVKAEMIPKMRRTRAITTRISPIKCFISTFSKIETLLAVMYLLKGLVESLETQIETHHIKFMFWAATCIINLDSL